jgi:nitronate monooxygenase
MTNTSNNEPIIIQGGMGAAVSNWHLANTVSRYGQLGVVSGTALDFALARRLQLGDPGGHMRRALAAFPRQDIATWILDTYFIAGGKEDNQPFKNVPMFKVEMSKKIMELNVVANFVEIWLAKEGHANPVGINYLEKIQMPNLTAIFGAMLAGVDYILMGAGIPREIPGILDRYVNYEPAELTLDVKNETKGQTTKMSFDPRQVIPHPKSRLKRPKFIAIISSNILALTLAKKASGNIHGFVVEGHSAGGHNAPPRGTLELNSSGEPVYGTKDGVDIDKIKALGKPFWLAGEYGHRHKIAEARNLGAAGVQVGTPFAFCHESGLDPKYRKDILKLVAEQKIEVHTDPVASPTGYPFKVVQLKGSMSEAEELLVRQRICNLGFLRHLYRTEDGKLLYRCPAEPIEDYLRKEGAEEETTGRKCLCNSLMANVSYAQIQQKNGYREKPIITAGKDIVNLGIYSKNGSDYSAIDVLDHLLQEAN